MSKFSTWVNPYRAKLQDYAERIFSLEDNLPALRSQVQALMDASTQCFCEIGSGSGNHLVELGRRCPDAAVFGFEIRYKRSVRTIEKAMAADVENVYVLRMPAENMEKIFPPRSLARVYVNFPDPWAKRKQWKHRVLSEEFLNSMQQLLTEEGLVSVKTDHNEYYESFREILRADSRFSCFAETRDYYRSEFCQENIETEFELLFKHKGQRINFLSFSRQT